MTHYRSYERGGAGAKVKSEVKPERVTRKKLFGVELRTEAALLELRIFRDFETISHC